MNCVSAREEHAPRTGSLLAFTTSARDQYKPSQKQLDTSIISDRWKIDSKVALKENLPEQSDSES